MFNFYKSENFEIKRKFNEKLIFIFALLILVLKALKLLVKKN